MKLRQQREDESNLGGHIQDFHSSYYNQFPYPPQPTTSQIGNPYFAGVSNMSLPYNQIPPPLPFLQPFPFPQGSVSGFHDFARNYHTNCTPSQQPQNSQRSRRRSPPQSQQSIPGLKVPQDTMSSSLSTASPFRPARNVAIPPSSGIPTPTPTYNANSQIPYTILEQPQHLLVIIDLNGTLLHRPSKANPTKFTARPHTPRFLNYCINTFTVVIWSSARPTNVQAMCAQILPPALRSSVAAIWGRDKFGLTAGEYNNKVQCYKRLSTVWLDKAVKASHPEAMFGGKWDQSNTVLIDDSLYKGMSEPFNLIEIPEFSGKEGEREGVLPQVHDYLNRLSMCSNVSNYLRRHPFQYRAEPAGAIKSG